MSKSGWARLAIWFGGAVIAVASFMALKPGWLGLAASAGVMVASSLLAEWVFSRLATPDEVRCDLEDRVRNPPD